MGYPGIRDENDEEEGLTRGGSCKSSIDVLAGDREYALFWEGRICRS